MNLGRGNGTLTMNYQHGRSYTTLAHWIVLSIVWFYRYFLVDDHLSWSWFLLLVLADGQQNSLEGCMILVLLVKDFCVIIFVINSFCSQTKRLCSLYTDSLWKAMDHSRSWVNCYFVSVLSYIVCLLIVTPYVVLTE